MHSILTSSFFSPACLDLEAVVSVGIFVCRSRVHDLLSSDRTRVDCMVPFFLLVRLQSRRFVGYAGLTSRLVAMRRVLEELIR